MGSGAVESAAVAHEPDEGTASTVSFVAEAVAFFAGHGVHVERVMTDGKAERFIGTLQREWAYARLFRSNEERLATLSGWVDAYNCRRPHAGLEGQTPLSVLVNKVDGNDI